MADNADNDVNVEAAQTSNTSSESDKNRSAVWKFLRRNWQLVWFVMLLWNSMVELRSSIKEHLKMKKSYR